MNELSGCDWMEMKRNYLSKIKQRCIINEEIALFNLIPNDLINYL